MTSMSDAFLLAVNVSPTARVIGEKGMMRESACLDFTSRRAEEGATEGRRLHEHNASRWLLC